jgi:prepilin-type N-terminal cleavage/methylation domain-containing protein
MKKNKKGFTLAELLVVVAIIAVLVAISIPIFNNQMKKARLATNKANARAAFSAAEVAYLDYVAGHGSVKEYNSKYHTVTYMYFTAAGKGVFNDSPGYWVVDSNGKISTNTDVSSWTPDTELSDGHMLGDLVADIWTIHMNPDTGAIVGYYCAFATHGKEKYQNEYKKYKEIIKALSEGNKWHS